MSGRLLQCSIFANVFDTHAGHRGSIPGRDSSTAKRSATSVSATGPRR